VKLIITLNEEGFVVKLLDLWMLYEADKRILGFSPHTLKAYSLQLKVLIREIGNLEIEEVTPTLLKDYLAKQSERLKPSSLGHRIRFLRSVFRFAFEEDAILRSPAIRHANMHSWSFYIVQAVELAKSIV
jgi:site-specific recombinase XerD